MESSELANASESLSEPQRVDERQPVEENRKDGTIDYETPQFDIGLQSRLQSRPSVSKLPPLDTRPGFADAGPSIVDVKLPSLDTGPGWDEECDALMARTRKLLQEVKPRGPRRRRNHDTLACR